MAVLVTGGTGDIGSYLVKELSGSGVDTVAFDVAPRPAAVKDVLSAIKLVKGNITNMGELLDCVKGFHVDRIIHLAALLTADAESRPHEAAYVNTTGTLNVLEAARLMDVKRVVYASTSSVYGPTPDDALVDENYPKNPRNIYAASKYASELYGQLYSEKYGFEFTAIRLRILLSPAQRRDTGAMHLLAGMIDSLVKGEPAKMLAPADKKMIFTYVRDAARAFKLANNVEKLRHKAYNIMTGQYTIQEIADALKRVVPNARILPWDPKASFRASLVSFGRYDISLAQNELGYTAGFRLDEMMRDLVANWSPRG